jgi:hypothetical protein
MNLRTFRFIGLSAALVAAALLTGCASGVKRTDGGKASVFQPSAEFPIGRVEVKVTEQALAKLKGNFKFSKDQLRGAIQRSLTANQLYRDQSGVTLEVTVTRVRVRSTFNAVMWGAMAGNDALEGDILVKDAAGKSLDRFAVSASYALGGFAGGQDKARTGWLYEAFAKEVLGQFKPDLKGDGKNAK